MPIAIDLPKEAQRFAEEQETKARRKLRRLWQLGDLFHTTDRYPRKPTALPMDRLAGILRNGIVAPAACEDGAVCSDLNILATGLSVPYDSLVFLHRFGEQSFIYTFITPGRFAVFVEPGLAMLTQEEMGEKWVVLCRDEVYVRERVAAEKLIGVVVHSEDAEAVLAEFLPELRRLEIPLYLCDGTVIWPPTDLSENNVS